MNKTTNYASFWIRLLAYILDNAIISFITLPFIWYIGDENLLKRTSFIYLAGLYYNIFLVYKYHTTIGKSLLNIEISSKNKITLWKVILREVIGKFLSSATLLIGYVIVLIDKNKQALHDKIAKTFVIQINNEKISTKRIFIVIILIFLIIYLCSYIEKEMFGFNYEENIFKFTINN